MKKPTESQIQQARGDIAVAILESKDGDYITQATVFKGLLIAGGLI